MKSITKLPTRSFSVPLNNNIFASYGSNVQVSMYNRSLVKPAIVHLGVGAFNRSHLNVYTDTILHSEDNKDWGIVGAGLL